MKYNIIGDIHGRDSWKSLVEDDAINVFVGDYFDPYFDIPFEDLENNFMDIMVYADTHSPNTILLFGNHDYCPYVLMNEKYSRYMRFYAQNIHKLFDENKDLFHGIAYSIGDKYLITHAGLTQAWWKKRLGDTGVEIPSPKFAEDEINELFKTNGDIPFTFKDNCGRFDMYGDTPQQSPLWIRPETLLRNWGIWDKKSEYTQVVGHTSVSDLILKFEKEDGTNKVIFTDCLGEKTSCLHIESSDDGTYKEYCKWYNPITKEATLKELNIIKNVNEIC